MSSSHCPLAIRWQRPTSTWPPAATTPGPAEARAYHGGKGNAAYARVVSGHGAGGSDRSVKLQDAPELDHFYNPHFFYSPGHTAGVTRLAFDFQVEKDSVWFLHGALAAGGALAVSTTVSNRPAVAAEKTQLEPGGATFGLPMLAYLPFAFAKNLQAGSESSMGMSPRERILAVYSGGVPDVVPYMLDLSHWFYHKNRLPWDLSVAYETPERDLIDCHKRFGCGFYMPNLASFYGVSFPEDVAAETEKQVRKDGSPEIVWRLKTPLGEIERRRVWEETTYGWGISRWGVQTEQDLAVFTDAMSRRRFAPKWQNYRAWVEEVGALGVVYLSAGYSAIGYLLNYWMGVERVAYATVDFPEALREAVEAVNANNLELIDLLAQSPAEIVIMGDNFSSDVQPPAFFAKWSKSYYDEAVRRLHAAGKRVALHIDGRLRSAIRMIRQTGADCGDAITPTPMGDLTPEACRDEAGPNFILSGGVSPDLWLPGVPLDVFKAKVIEWLELRRRSPRLIAGAGDQVPPGADEDRIRIMQDLVEEHGRY